jgi:hypothetical protein
MNPSIISDNFEAIQPVFFTDPTTPADFSKLWDKG